MALRRLKGLQTHTARQLYEAIVAPILDFASPIWSPTATKILLRTFEPAQRIAALAISEGRYPLAHRFYATFLFHLTVTTEHLHHQSV